VIAKGNPLGTIKPAGIGQKKPALREKTERKVPRGDQQLIAGKSLLKGQREIAGRAGRTGMKIARQRRSLGTTWDHLTRRMLYENVDLEGWQKTQAKSGGALCDAGTKHAKAQALGPRTRTPALLRK